MCDREPPKEEHAWEEELADLVKRSLVQMGEMERIQDRMKEIAEKWSKVTPPQRKASDIIEEPGVN
jgi:hypothetical protein